MQQSPAVQLPQSDVPIGIATDWRQSGGRALLVLASVILVAAIGVQLLKTAGVIAFGFENWRPVAAIFVGWSLCLCAWLILTRGQRGEQAVFLLPAILVTFAFVLFPTIYALFIAFHSWNLSGTAGREFSGLENFRRMFADGGYWAAQRNMASYVAAVLVQYVIAFALAILLNQNIRGRKFFRVIFLLPFMFDPENMTPYVNNPAFVRAAQDVIDALPFEPPDQVNADGNRTWQEQFLPGIGTMLHWWGDVGSFVYTSDLSVVQDKVMFSILPGSDDVYNNVTGEWDTLSTGPNFSPNEAYIGWGLYVMNRAEEQGVSKAAWSIAAHLGGKDLGTWMAFYPSGFQPYRNSSFPEELWAGAGLPPDFVASYLASQADSYNHPNGAIEPRIPGIFQYYSAAEQELTRAYAGEVTAQEALDAAAAAWEQITDDLGRESQIALYQAALG